MRTTGQPVTRQRAQQDAAGAVWLVQRQIDGLNKLRIRNGTLTQHQREYLARLNRELASLEQTQKELNKL